jgi:thiamine monophosphate kinase
MLYVRYDALWDAVGSRAKQENYKSYMQDDPGYFSFSEREIVICKDTITHNLSFPREICKKNIVWNSRCLKCYVFGFKIWLL